MNEDSRHEPGLFDLPLEPRPPADSRGSARPPESSLRDDILPLFSEEEIDEALAVPFDDAPPHFASVESAVRPARARPVAVPAPAPSPPVASLARRVRAACGDLAVLAAAGVAAAIGARWLEAPLALAQLAPLALFVVCFSFVYFVVPLAFWGGTPGMIWTGLVARNAVTEPLSFGQSVLRWLGTWLTWALAGLPGLLALGGRSLADRLSSSATYDMTARPAPAR